MTPLQVQAKRLKAKKLAKQFAEQVRSRELEEYKRIGAGKIDVGLVKEKG